MTMTIEAEAPEKCPAKPTKKRWGSALEAWEAADERSAQYNVEIVPYRCDACGFLHLTKRTGGTSEIERRTGSEWFPPTNPATRRAALRALLADRTEISSVEAREALDVTQNTLTKYMQELGWVSGTGRGAKWTPGLTPVVPLVQPLRAVDKPVEDPVDLSMRRHPAAQDAGWRPLTKVDKIRHMALGDLLETLVAAGLEVRIQVRNI